MKTPYLRTPSEPPRWSWEDICCYSYCLMEYIYVMCALYWTISCMFNKWREREGVIYCLYYICIRMRTNRYINDERILMLLWLLASEYQKFEDLYTTTLIYTDIYISVCFVEGATNVFITAYCIKKIYSNRSHLLSLLEYSSFQELMRMNARATILSRTRKLVGRQSLSISARNYRNSCIYIFPFLFSHFSFFMEEVAILGDCNILMMGRKQHCTTALLLWCVSLSSLLLLRRP